MVGVIRSRHQLYIDRRVDVTVDIDLEDQNNLTPNLNVYPRDMDVEWSTARENASSGDEQRERCMWYDKLEQRHERKC